MVHFEKNLYFYKKPARTDMNPLVTSKVYLSEVRKMFPEHLLCDLVSIIVTYVHVSERDWLMSLLGNPEKDLVSGIYIYLTHLNNIPLLKPLRWQLHSMILDKKTHPLYSYNDHPVSESFHRIHKEMKILKNEEEYPKSGNYLLLYWRFNAWSHRFNKRIPIFIWKGM